MAVKYGLGSLNQSFNPTQNSDFNTLNNTGGITAVRVKSIVLDESHPRFKELGEWNGLGTIEYDSVIVPSSPKSFPTARPLLPNNKNYPLVNEIVYLLSLPSTKIGTSTDQKSNYYISIVSLWNHPHHNGYPITPNLPPPSQRKDYIQTSLGSVRRVTDQSTEIFLGKTFKERSNIHPLLPFEGDIITEGRWGNSIRIGSTVKNTPNNWSTTGTNGDPILILRNGQGKQSDQGWVPTVEDINNDDSSIYLTSTQQIPLKASSTSYISYKNNPPINPNQYNGKQIFINSGRLIFNSNEDHLLLSSNKSINLNALGSINIDTPSTIIQSDNIYLGSKNASEPLLLGDQTISLLNQLISNLSGFMVVCSTAVSTPPGTPLVQLNIAASQLNDSLQALQSNLESLKSKYNYTV